MTPAELSERLEEIDEMWHQIQVLRLRAQIELAEIRAELKADADTAETEE